MAVQTNCLVQQLRLARHLGRPVSLHCVRASGPMAENLRSEGPFPAGIVMHSFHGPAEMVDVIVRAAGRAYFSVSPRILAMRQDKAAAAIARIGIERLLIETDDAGIDQLASVAEGVARLMPGGMSAADVAEATFGNAAAVFSPGAC